MRILITIALTLSLVACGGNRPLPDEVAQLDTLTQGNLAASIDRTIEDIDDVNIRTLRQRALDMLRSAEVYHERSVELARKRRTEQAILLARVGLIYFSAAENYHRSAEARVRLTDSNQQYEAQRIRRNDYADQLESEQELIALLDTVNRLFQRNEELQRRIATLEEGARGESRALYTIQEARVLQREAQGSRADTYAADEYVQATATLNRSVGYFEDGDHERAYQTALESVELFGRAITAARPGFAQDQERLLRNPVAARVYEDAQRIFGERNAFIDSRGIVLVLGGLFDDGSDEIRANRTYLVDQVQGLMREYSDTRVTIEGHTSDRGEADGRRSLSDRRAAVVSRYLTTRDIRERRISTSGFGDTAPRFDNSTPDGRRDNERVEIVFTF